MYDEDATVERLESFAALGPITFIDLTGPHFPPPYTDMLPDVAKDFEYKRFPTAEMSVPESPARAVEILDAIDDAISRGRIAYVHCLAGVGRTGVVIGCWLARRCGDGEAALERLGELWQTNPDSSFSRTPDTERQARYIQEWKE